MKQVDFTQYLVILILCVKIYRQFSHAVYVGQRQKWKLIDHQADYKMFTGSSAPVGIRHQVGLSLFLRQSGSGTSL